MDAARLVEGVDSLSLVKFAIYPALVIIMALISIKFDLFAGKTKKPGNAAVSK